MASRRRIFDAVVRHRIDVQRYARDESGRRIRQLAREDARLVGLIRQRADRSAGRRSRQLLTATSELRAESIRGVRTELESALLTFGKQETATIARMMTAGVGEPVPWNPVGMARIQSIVTEQPFGGGKNAPRTLARWFGELTQADQTRLHDALQLGIANGESTDTMIRRLTGTRANGFADGVLSITRRQAETVVRTAVNHTANAAQLAWGDENSDVVSGYEWTAMLDERTCAMCDDLNGGFLAQSGGDAPDGMEAIDQSPPAHPACRCALVPVFDLDRLADKVPDEDLSDDEERPPLALVSGGSR